jgi:hypothetical protein
MAPGAEVEEVNVVVDPCKRRIVLNFMDLFHGFSEKRPCFPD